MTEHKKEPEEVAKELTAELLETIAHKSPGQEMRVLMNFLHSLVGTMVYQALSIPPNPNEDREEQLKFVENNYKLMKTNIQNAVGEAFKEAMQAYSGKSMDYYCQIKALPDPINKLPC
jgi:hypothetical protein